MASRSDPTFFTSVWCAHDEPRFAARAHWIFVPPGLDVLPRQPFNLRDEAMLFVAVLRAALHGRPLLLFSSRGRLKPELLASALLGLCPKGLRPPIIFYGEMYEPDAGWRGIGERLLVQLADRAVSRFVVYSQDEARLFASTWGVSPAKMRVSHFFFHDPSHAAGALEPPREERYIFAGGNSFRDYGPLIEAARALPDISFVICTSQLAHHDLPPNVQVGRVPPEVYRSLIAGATAVVIPLRSDLRRSAGLLTVMEAMALAKPIIVSDAVAVREYVEEGRTGMIVDGSPAGYLAALRWAMDPANATSLVRMGRAAQGVVEQRFTLEAHVSALLAVVDEVMVGEGAA